MLLVDMAFGVAALAVTAAGTASRPLRAFAAPVARVVLQPPLLPARLHPAVRLNGLAWRGAAYRRTSVHDLADLIDSIVSTLAVELEGRLDLTELIQRHVDLEAVIAQVDLAGLAQQVIAEIDLPEIIRESTGAMASDTLLGVRMRSISGDDAIGRAADRIRLRRARRPAAPSPSETGAPPDGRQENEASSNVDAPLRTP
ncbi:hypothetical protein [Aeromicrobium sp.]|uniref:hypothetical protein n=1 Tax=Aeromicrobium sp. TaxID=1871063 RepID=UPI003D6A6F43